jgi:hypothetical protein
MMLGMAKARSRRGEPPLPSLAVVLRGDLLEPDALRESAERNFDVYGFYGVSVIAETEAIRWVDLAAGRFTRAPWLVLFTAGDLRAAGLELWDTGQSRTTTWCTLNWMSSSVVSSGPCTAWFRTRSTIPIR